MELYKKRDIWTQRHAGKMPRDHIGRDECCGYKDGW